MQNHELPLKEDFEALVWGRARSKDLVHWEELPVALQADRPYDAHGVWSGTVIVKDRLYVFYAAIYQPDQDGARKETICMAYSDDGETFHKYEGNPLISEAPQAGGSDFQRSCLMYIGCLSTSMEITVKNGKFYGYPVEEAQYMLKNSDPAVKCTENGFIVERKDFPTVEYKGQITDLEIIRDAYLLEIFVNKSEHVYSVVLC